MKMPNLENTEVVLVHPNLVDNDYQHDPKLMYTFIPNKLIGQLLDVSPKNFIFLKTFNSKCLHVEVWFTARNSKPLEIEDKIIITLVNTKV